MPRPLRRRRYPVQWFRRRVKFRLWWAPSASKKTAEAAIGGAIFGALSGMTGYHLTSTIGGQKTTIGGFVVAAIFGAATGGFSGATFVANSVVANGLTAYALGVVVGARWGLVAGSLGYLTDQWYYNNRSPYDIFLDNP